MVGVPLPSCPLALALLPAPLPSGTRVSPAAHRARGSSRRSRGRPLAQGAGGAQCRSRSQSCPRRPQLRPPPCPRGSRSSGAPGFGSRRLGHLPRQTSPTRTSRIDSNQSKYAPATRRRLTHRWPQSRPKQGLSRRPPGQGRQGPNKQRPRTRTDRHRGAPLPRSGPRLRPAMV